jgi:beta-lactamase class A
MRKAVSTKLGVTVVAGALLVAGTACGAGTVSAASRPASRTGTSVAPGGLQQELRSLEGSYQARIGAFALDTGSGKTSGYRMDERFPLLSTSKAMTGAAILNKARRSDPALLDRVIHWTADEEVANSPITAGHGTTGMTVAHLAEAAFTVSDNTAANLLLKQIGAPAGLTRYFRSLHDPISRLDRWETDLNNWRPGEQRDTTTAAVIGRDLRQVTVGAALTAADRERLNGWLRSCTTGTERIRAGLPKDWTVGDKTGTASTYATANDIAIAWPPHGAPLIIAIYTNRTNGAPIDNKLISTTASLLVRSLTKTS